MRVAIDCRSKIWVAVLKSTVLNYTAPYARRQYIIHATSCLKSFREAAVTDHVRRKPLHGEGTFNCELKTENKALVLLVQFSRQTGENLTGLLICIFDFLGTAFCPSVCMVVGVISCPHGGKSSCRNRFLRSPLDIQLPVINKLHSYYSMDRAERFCPTSSECQSRPTFIFTASPCMSQQINILEK
jgi:hypothetical protein